MKVSFSKWKSSGEPWVWINAGSVTVSLVMVFGLLALIAVKGLAHFWPGDLLAAQYMVNGKSMHLLGEEVEREEVAVEQLRTAGLEVDPSIESHARVLLKIGNRDVGGFDFKWILEETLLDRQYPKDAIAIERREWGTFTVTCWPCWKMVRRSLRVRSPGRHCNPE